MTSTLSSLDWPFWNFSFNTVSFPDFSFIFLRGGGKGRGHPSFLHRKCVVVVVVVVVVVAVVAFCGCVNNVRVPTFSIIFQFYFHFFWEGGGGVFSASRRHLMGAL